MQLLRADCNGETSTAGQSAGRHRQGRRQAKRRRVVCPRRPRHAPSGNSARLDVAQRDGSWIGPRRGGAPRRLPPEGPPRNNKLGGCIFNQGVLWIEACRTAAGRPSPPGPRPLDWPRGLAAAAQPALLLSYTGVNRRPKTAQPQRKYYSFLLCLMTEVGSAQQNFVSVEGT